VAKTQVHHKLGSFAATAIAGNDILSSCLYVTGIATLFAGAWAPLIFLLIAGVLWLYKHVYTEVVEALPLNGGAYNCLLNATTKNLAAIAGVMTVLSYVATSVISAKTAAEYLHTVIHTLPVMPVTSAIIIGFAILTILGVKDSAKVAIGIFLFHIFVLTLFVSTGILTIGNLGLGWIPDSLAKTQAIFAEQGMVKMLFLAFAASLLGVSGFESSANFVEEQAPGVFRKTLRNMLLGVLIFNPLITIVMLSSMSLDSIATAKDFVLAESALFVGGKTLQYLVVADAFLVLSGAVLASFVGATGLLYRMTLDHCLPSSILLPKLKKRNMNSNRIVIAFAGLCFSILFMTGGHLLALAGVYTISFLGVMTAFALGNMVLRQTRPDLKRTYQGPILYVILAALATTAGIVGNIYIDPKNLIYFLTYFLPALALVMSMIYRDYILETLMRITKPFTWLHRQVEKLFIHVTKPRIILFAHHPEKLFASLQYIQKNETSRNILVLFCARKSENTTYATAKFQDFIQTFKEAHVFPNLSITFAVEHNEAFGPEVIHTYAHRYKMQRNNIFIGSIHHHHNFDFEELGGVRIIQ
jgi:amino acid transporter